MILRVPNLLLVALVAVFASGVSAQSFAFYRQISANNAGSSAVTNHQVLVQLNTSNFNYTTVRADGFDVRFFTSGGVTPLNYYVETWNPSGTSLLWVLLPNVPASGSVNFEMHYGDAAFGTNGSNFAATFPSAFVSTGSTTLSGVQSFDWFEVAAGDTITVGAGSVFTVNARRVIVAGNINANGAGNQIPGTPSQPGTGPGAGAIASPMNSGSGGGGHGGAGGVGCSDAGDTPGAGGVANGSATDLSIGMGSSGGSSDNTLGGNGGGGINLRGFLVTIGGTITANGNPGVLPGGSRGGGGGAGGGILIGGFDVTISSALSARGGQGSDGTASANDGGGGGGGGRIKLFHENSIANTSTTDVAGGAAGINGSVPGGPGVVGSTHAALDAAVIDEVTATLGAQQSFNSAPVLALATSTDFVAGSDFDLTVAPAGSLAGTNGAVLTVTDATPDPVDATITFTTGPQGATPPTGIAAPANVTAGAGAGFNLTWTGTADATNTPGTYVWNVLLTDGVSNVNRSVRIIITNAAPAHVVIAPTTGDGSVGTPYTRSIDIGSTTAVNIATVSDANTGQNLNFVSQTLTASPVWFERDAHLLAQPRCRQPRHAGLHSLGGGSGGPRRLRLHDRG